MQVVTSQNFEKEVLNSEIPVVVDFFASWCGPCRALTPMLEDIAKELKGAVKIVKVDTEQSEDLAIQYKIQGLPTLLFFNKGEVIKTIVGNRPEIRSEITSFK